jgi:rare lipoprotein A
MHSAPNKSRAGALAVAIAILSLGNAAVSPAQVMNSSKKPNVSEGLAVWYEVPPSSLAKRRSKDELTAAHNKLPLGAKVRVTHLGNGKNVVVRITDRGITSRHVTIDLCKEAAAKLDMLREGSARVRIEVLPNDKPFSKSAGPPW